MCACKFDNTLGVLVSFLLATPHQEITTNVLHNNTAPINLIGKNLSIICQGLVGDYNMSSTLLELRIENPLPSGYIAIVDTE